MAKLFHPLLALIASATDRELARHIRYLKEENRILRARIPGQIHTRKGERTQLLKFGKPIGRAIEQLITIVTPGTFYRWVRDETRGNKSEPTGRPATRRVLRELVLKIAKETGFGYTRILGELRRLGVSRICRQTVKNIIKEEGIEPSPKRSKRTWNEYVQTHAETLWACDFFSVRIVTSRGLARLYVLVFMHLDMREVFLTSATDHPNSTWMSKQAKAFLEDVQHRDPKPAILLRDRDTQFTRQFDEQLAEQAIKTKKLPVRSPNLNARVERFVQTIRRECLDQFIVFGKRHLDYLVQNYVAYYNEHRAHSSREFLPPKCTSAPEENNVVNLDEIRCREHVGGLVKSYERVAA